MPTLIFDFRLSIALLAYGQLPDLSSFKEGYCNQDKGGSVNQPINAAGGYVAGCYSTALLVNGIANPEYLKAGDYYFAYFRPQVAFGKSSKHIIAYKAEEKQAYTTAEGYKDIEACREHQGRCC